MFFGKALSGVWSVDSRLRGSDGKDRDKAGMADVPASFRIKERNFSVTTEATGFSIGGTHRYFKGLI